MIVYVSQYSIYCKLNVSIVVNDKNLTKANNQVKLFLMKYDKIEVKIHVY